MFQIFLDKQPSAVLFIYAVNLLQLKCLYCRCLAPLRILSTPRTKEQTYLQMHLELQGTVHYTHNITLYPKQIFSWGAFEIWWGGF